MKKLLLQCKRVQIRFVLNCGAKVVRIYEAGFSLHFKLIGACNKANQKKKRMFSMLQNANSVLQKIKFYIYNKY